MISVLIPTYNCGRYLCESLDSILAQTYRDREIVVVDDGSTDDTPSILASYRDRVRVVRGRHQGLSAARNLCLAHARGEWIAFHDADDIALAGRLERLLAVLQANPSCEAVFANGERLDDGSRLVPAALAARALGRPLNATDLFAGFPVYFQGALVARRAFAAAGSFDPTLRIQPDIEYAYRLFSRCRAIFVDEVVFRYRRHGTSNSSDLVGGREDIARILERLARSDPEAVRLIGRHRLAARLARHHYRLARARLAQGETAAARHHLARALHLRPFHPRYRWLQLSLGS